ncbi:MAG: hypothetical protein Q4F83_10180 [Eubacteriales bacterium]|nr:hypothetical protein [Eubacteriales bacterium]
MGRNKNKLGGKQSAVQLKKDDMDSSGIRKDMTAEFSDFDQVNEKYKPDWIKEYNMMREELVNYMDKMQDVRNMMYIAVGTTFVFTLSANVHFLSKLLPLLFILPSYMCATNYWLGVRKASAYLVVFHESYDDCPIHWESRNSMLKKVKKRIRDSRSKSTFFSVGSQLGSYYACASVIMIFYVLQICQYVANKKKLDNSLVFWKIRISGVPILVYIIAGSAITLFLLWFFVHYSKGESYKDLIIKFLLIKKKEEQQKIGKCWPNGKSDIDADNALFKEISEDVERWL